MAKILSMPAGSVPQPVPDYIFNNGAFLVPLANYAYKAYGDSNETFVGTMAISGNNFTLSFAANTNGKVTSYITDEIDFTNVDAITLYRDSSASFGNASMFTIAELKDDYIATTPPVNLAANQQTHTLNTQSLIGKHRLVIKIERTTATAGSLTIGTVAIVKAS